MISKKILDAAYRDYARANANPMRRVVWEKIITGQARPPRKPKNPIVVRRSWTDIQREYLRWRKTEDFQKWSRRQFLKQGGTCYYCDQPLAGVRQNVEHIIPKIRGGDNRKSNLVLACSACNKEKYTSVLSRARKNSLRVKNSAKKGTWLKLKEEYPTELDLAYRLREMFRED